MNHPRLTPAQQVRANERRRARDLLESQVRLAIQEAVPDLSRGVQGAGLTQSQLSQLEAKFSAGNSMYRIRAARRVLRMVLKELGQQTGGSVAIPDVEVTIKRRPSPFAGTAIRRVKQLHDVIDLHLASIIKDPPTEPSTEAGRILFSAVTLGGLLAKSLISALPEALREGARAYKDLFWIEIKLESGQVRRWFPDPVTASLILRWIHSSRTWPANRSARQCLNAYLSRLVECGPNELGDMEQLRSAAEARLRLLVPGLIVDHLASIRTSQSLPQKAWWRLIADYHLDEDGGDGDEEVEPDLTVGGELCLGPRSCTSSRGVDDVDPQVVLKGFMRELRDQNSKFLASRTVAARNLRRFYDECTASDQPMLQALMGWGIWLLEPGHSTRLRPSSVGRYLSAVGPAILKLAGEVDPSDATAEELGSIYESVLQSTHSAQGRAMAISSLRSFQAFLLTNHGADPAPIDGQEVVGQVVRANVISNTEYELVRQMIRQSGFFDPLVQRLELMVVLLYRLGLRKNELRYICLQDLQIDKQGKRPLLWVHGHPQRQLKTSSSTRRLPLQHLLTNSEWRLLHDYYRLRVRECRNILTKRVLLFPKIGSEVEPMPEKQMEYLVEVMRQVCNDKSLVLHSLRHTFLNNLFIDIMLAGIEPVDTGRFSRKVVELMPWHVNRPSQNPIKTLFVADRLPRNAAYGMAVLAGHLGPAETLNTYVHSQDYLAFLYLREDALAHKAELWAGLEGVGTSSIHVRHSRERKKTGQEVVASIDTPTRLLKKCRLSLPPGSYADRTSMARRPKVAMYSGNEGLTLEGAYRAISTATQFNSSTMREMLTGMNITKLQYMESNARFLASLQTDAPKREARRSRLLVEHGGRLRPSIIRLPQLDHLGPAIPKPIAERRQAQTVFDRATGKNYADPDDLLELLKHTSRTKPWLRLYSIDDVVRFMRLLSQLGIPFAHQELVITSLPQDCKSAKDHLRMVRRLVGANGCSIGLAHHDKKMPTSNKTNPNGVFHLAVRTKGRRMTGWRVGAYYAACVRATDEGIDWGVAEM